MASAGGKTKETSETVSAFISGLSPDSRKTDAETLLRLFQTVTRCDPKMWGPTIIGFGRYHYKYDSGREGDTCRSGFSPRKANMTIYLMGGYCNPATEKKLAGLRKRLGKHRTGASCLYINKLADVDVDVLREMIAIDLAYMNDKYPSG